MYTRIAVSFVCKYMNKQRMNKMMISTIIEDYNLICVHIKESSLLVSIILRICNSSLNKKS